jgi:hypothetical protein
MIMRRSALGSLKVIETFPLTEDGWTSAWQAFLRQNPAAVHKVLASLRAREADAARLGSPGPRKSARATDTAGRIEYSAPATSVSSFKELTKLAEMLEKGLLSREEFDLMKAKLLGL